MKTVIHVNQHVIRANRAVTPEDRQPVITCKTYRDNQYAHEVHIDGPSRIVYRPDQPLSCGATVWIETDSAVIIVR